MKRIMCNFGLTARCLILAILLLTAAIIPTTDLSAATVIIDTVPFYAPNHSGDEWDTLVIHPDSNGVLHSQNHGVVMGSSQNDKWVFNLSGDDGLAGTADDDTIIFGIDTTFIVNAYVASCGVVLSRIYDGTGADSVKFFGGFYLHRPTGVDTSTVHSENFDLRGRNVGIMAWYGYSANQDIHLDGVTIEILGYHPSTVGWSSCITMRGGRGWLIENCRFYNYVFGWETRTYFTSSAMHFSDPSFPTLDDDDDYHVKIVDSYIYSRGHCGIVAWAHGGDANTNPYIRFQMEGCSLIVDQHNTTTVTGHCYVNGYGIMARGLGPGSYIKDNVFLSGDQYNGGRGIEFRECNNVPYTSTYWPSYTDTIEVYKNYFDMHQGRDEEFNTNIWSSMCVKIRRGNHYLWLHDNTFVQTLDTHTTVSQGYSPMGMAVSLQVEMDAGDTDRSPYHITFENNLCSLKVVTANETYRGEAVNLQSNIMLSERDTTIKWRNNYYYSEGGGAVIFAPNWDATGKEFTLVGDTLDVSDTKGVHYGTINLGAYRGSADHIIRDGVYLNKANPTSVYHRGALGVTYNNYDRYWTLWNQRTLRLFARGNNDLPVINAACSVWNNYDQLVLTGTSNGGGEVKGPVSYYYYDRNNSDSAYYQDFTIKMVSGSDVAINNSFTVDWIPAGGTDTLDLANTIGTGEWGVDTGGVVIDTIPPGPVIDFGTLAYPNPVYFANGDHVVFDLPEGQFDLIIQTVSGSIVLVRTNISGNYSWNGLNESGHRVAAGIYLWYVSGTNGVTKGKLAVKS